jgi:hypothetical protein
MVRLRRRRFDEDGTNKETIMRFLSMALDEVSALVALDAGVLNVECPNKPPS